MKPRAVLFKNDSSSQAIASRRHLQGTPMRKLLALTASALALAIVTIAAIDQPAWSQAARTIRVVITVPPGGSIDILFRLLADQISSTQGQTVIIESRPGAGGVIAAEAVARAAPDGNTLLSNNNGIIISSILRKVNYDPLTSFEPICYLVSTPQDRRRQQRIALPHAGGAAGRGPRQAGRVVDRERRTQHHPASRH